MDPRSQEMKTKSWILSAPSIPFDGSIGGDLPSQIVKGADSNTREGDFIFLKNLRLIIVCENVSALPSPQTYRDFYVAFYLVKRFQGDGRALAAADLVPTGHAGALGEMYQWPEAKPVDAKGTEVIYKKEWKINMNRFGANSTDRDYNFNVYAKKNIHFNPPLRIQYYPGAVATTYADIVKNQIFPVYTGAYLKNLDYNSLSGVVRYQVRYELEWYE